MSRLIITLGAVALLLATVALWLSSGISTAKPRLAESPEPAQTTKALTASDGSLSASLAQSSEAEQGAADPVTESEDPNEDGRGLALESALVAQVRNTSLSDQERLEALRQLVRKGGKSAVEEAIRAVRDAIAADETSAIAASLAAQLAGLTTPEAVEVMGEILTDRHTSIGPFASLPVTLQDGISGSLRKNPDSILVAKSLSEQFIASAGSISAQSRVEMLEHPETTSRLAELAQASADEALLQERLAMLQTTRDARVYDTLVRLAQEGSIPRESLDEAMLNWASRRPESVDFDRLLATAADSESTIEQRSFAALGVAAYAQATPEAREQVRETLSKPLADQALDNRVRSSFQQALARLNL